MNLISRLFGWIWRGLRMRLGLRGLAAILLMVVALRAVMTGLTEAAGGGELGQTAFTISASLSVLIGWLTARRRGWAFRLTAWLLFGTAVVLLTNAGLWAELFAAARAAVLYGIDWTAEHLQREPFTVPASLTPLRLAWERFAGGARIELDVIATWIEGLLSGQPAFQSEAVAFALGAGLWALGLYTGFVMRRSGSAAAALLPAGVALMVAMARTADRNTLPLTIFILAGLLLSAVQTQYKNERRWADRAMMYAEDLRLDFTIAASVLVGGIITLAFVVPQLELGTAIRLLIDRASEAGGGSGEFRDASGDQSALPRPSPAPPFFDGFRSGGLPRSHLLGAGPELAEEIALTVRVFGEAVPGAGSYYWRGLNYDIYTGAGWETGEVETVRYEAGWQVARPVESFTRPFRQEVDLAAAPGGIGYAAGEIFSADRTFTVAWRSPGPGLSDVFGVRIDSGIYTVDSSYPYLLPEPLRTAGIAYPDWVTDRYLALPVELPDRIRDLASSLTADTGNPFDAAEEIERYLRGFEYTLELGPPPAGRDVTDYFLFELQRGYCDYFATAMVVLARAAGIPARLATGYAGGAYDPEAERYIVSALNAHSWPELYFPGFGWVPFEPTSGVAPIDRDAAGGLPAGPPPELPPLEAAPPGWLRAVNLIAAVAAALVVVLATGRRLRERARIRALSPGEFLSEAFRWVYAAGRDLGVAVPARATPIEMERGLSAHLGAVQERNRLARRLPPVGPDLKRLTDTYVRLQYAGDAPSKREKEREIVLLRRLRVLVWIARIDHRIGDDRKK